MVGVSSWVSLGKPARCRGALPAPNTPAHVRALVHLESSSLRWIHLTANDLVCSGRRRPAVASQLASLSGWLEANACPGYSLVMGGPPPMAVAIKPLVPERMALPERGGASIWRCGCPSRSDQSIAVLG